MGKYKHGLEKQLQMHMAQTQHTQSHTPYASLTKVADLSNNNADNPGTTCIHKVSPVYW